MSEIDPHLPYGYTEFCDDIRREIGGKLTLVGMYNSEIRLLGEPPFLLPKLALRVNWFEALGNETGPLELRVYMPGDSEDEPTAKAEIPSRPSTPVPLNTDPTVGQRSAFNMILEFAPLQIARRGVIKVRMKKGDDVYRVGALRVTEMTADEAIALGAPILQAAAPANEGAAPNG